MPKNSSNRPKKPVDEEHRLALEKVKELSTKISKLSVERRKVAPLDKYNNLSGITKSGALPRKKKVREFFHPTLDYVFAEVSNSPYLTHPLENYSTETLLTSKRLRTLKRNNVGKKLREIEDIPVDIDKSREIFMKEVVEFLPRFEVG